MLGKNIRQSSNFDNGRQTAVARAGHVKVFYRVSIHCRVFSCCLPSVWYTTLGKSCFLPSAICMPSVFCTTLGKSALCRVRDGMHSANQKTLSIFTVSGSGCLESSCQLPVIQYAFVFLAMLHTYICVSHSQFRLYQFLSTGCMCILLVPLYMLPPSPKDYPGSKLE